MLLIPGEATPDVASLVAPAAYHVVQVGTPDKVVKRMLGPASHGSWSCYWTFNTKTGWHSGTRGTARWYGTFGTITVHHFNGKVTAKSFNPNYKGNQVLTIIRHGWLRLCTRSLRRQDAHFEIQRLRN